VSTLELIYPTLIGNLVALLSPFIYIPIISAFKPQNFDFTIFQTISLVDDSTPDWHEALDAEKEQKKIASASRTAKLVGMAIVISLVVLWIMVKSQLLSCLPVLTIPLLAHLRHAIYLLEAMCVVASRLRIDRSSNN
jgi:hypothetical protein